MRETFDTVIRRGQLVLPDGRSTRGDVGIKDGKIVALAPRLDAEWAHQEIDVSGAWLGPGFVDIHMHGAFGIDGIRADAEQLLELARKLRNSGVTSFLVGVSTLNHKETLLALHNVREAMEIAETEPTGGARILGVYMEGPYLSQAKRGAHDPKLVRNFDPAQMRVYLDTADIRAVAFAPEMPGARELLRLLCDEGVTPIAGHTDATFAMVRDFVGQGVRAMTHTFNGMRGLHHREPGAVGAALLLPDVVAELIADGVHVVPELFELVWRMKGPHGLALITDSGAFGGMPDGEYEVGGSPVRVANGVGVNAEGIIAGSAGTYAANFWRFVNNAQATVPEAWPVASGTPARLAQVAASRGQLDIGFDGDLVAVSESGKMIGTCVGGEWRDAE